MYILSLSFSIFHFPSTHLYTHALTHLGGGGKGGAVKEQEKKGKEDKGGG